MYAGSYVTLLEVLFLIPAECTSNLHVPGAVVASAVAKSQFFGPSERSSLQARLNHSRDAALVWGCGVEFGAGHGHLP